MLQFTDITLMTIIAMSANFCLGQNIAFRPERQLTASPQCDRTFNTQQFSIEVLETPRSAFFECQFHVLPFSPNVCRLRINFQQFQLPSSCREQYLQINNRRLCGSISGTQIFQFNNSSLVIKYRGLGAQTMRLDVEQELCRQTNSPTQDCDVISADLETEIKSPNFPDSYTVPVSCKYTIVPASPDICRVHVKFTEFNLPESVDCLKARLTIDNYSFCGLKSGWTFVSNITDSFVTEFSAVSRQFLGHFRVSLKQIACENPSQLLNNTLENRISYLPPPLPCPRCCNRVFNAPSFVIHNPGILDVPKPSDFNCIYQIAPSSPNICRLRFNFIHFSLGQEDVYYGCTDSFLEIDGRRWCGCKDGVVVFSHYQTSGKDVFLSMRGPQNRGFIIEVFQEECGSYRGRSIPEELTTINPNSEVEVFSNSTVEKVRSRFLIPNDEGRCFDWSLPHLADKIRALLKSVPYTCPVQPQNPIQPPAYPENPILPPVFPHNPIQPPIFPQNPPLFPVNPVQPPPTFPQNPIQPPVPPPVYPGNPILPPLFPQNPIRPPLFPENPILPPIFPQNPIQPPKPHNPIQPPIYPPRPPVIPFPPPSCPQPPAPFPPVKPPMWTPRPPHFPVPSQRCLWLASLQGAIHSPGYPWQYPPNQKCCYRIQQAPGFCHLQLTVIDFDIVWSPKCWKDYFLVDQGARYCGQSLQASIVYVPFRQGLASLDFITDGYLAGRGFKAVYRQTPCRTPYNSKSDDIPAIPAEDVLVLNETVV